MKRFLLAGAGLMALSVASAIAADIPARMPTKAPVMVRGYNWSGWYIGIQGGYGWGRSSFTDTGTGVSTGDFDVDGGLVGGTLGVNWQAPGSQWVFGLEGDGSWSGMRGSTTVGCVPGCETRNNWLATFRGRIGYAFDRVLPYVTGGLAAGDIEANITGFPTQSDTRVGWTVGAGVEWAIAGPWTAKVEYLYADLDKMSCGLASCPVVIGPTDVTLDANIFRAGVNYRFGGAGY